MKQFVRRFSKIQKDFYSLFLITKKLSLITIVAFLSFACSGGGGGGGSSGGGAGSVACSYQGSSYSGCYPARYSTNTYETLEYDNDYGLADMNASSAYSRELTGAGVRVGIFDTGVKTTHKEFATVSVTGWNYETGNSVLQDGHGHGTHVAGTIAAVKGNGDESSRGMHGVAYGVTNISSYKIFDNNGSFSGSYNTMIPDAVSKSISAGVKVINHSWGTQAMITSYSKSVFEAAYSTAINSYKSLQTNGIINVWATGNNSRANPNFEAGMPYHWSGTADVWIAVMGIDADGNEYQYGNRCGVAAAWCIAAPSVSVYSAGITSNSAYTTLTGTSMGAPHVTGAIAILIEAFPTLTAAQIVDRLLQTASTSGLTGRNGESYSSAIFGVGKIDLEKATRPIAVLGLSVGGTSVLNSKFYTLQSTKLSLSKAFGQNRILNNTLKNINSLTQQIISTESIASFDTYDNAIFFLNLSSLSTGSTYTPLGLNRMVLKDYEEQSLYDFGILKLYGIVNATNIETDQYNFPFKTIRATLSLNDYFKIKYNYAEVQDYFFLSTKKDLRVTESLFTYDAFRNPYMGMSGEFESLELFLKVNNKLKISVNYNEEGYVQELETNLTERKKDIRLKGLNAYLKSSFLDKMNLSYSRMEEEGAFLGSQTSGAFKLRNASVTDIFGAMIEKMITSKLTIYASGFYGSTKVYPDIDSLFSDFKTIQSTSWSFGLLNDKVVRKNDSIGLVVHQPIRAESGSFDLRLPHYADSRGTIYYKDEAFSLKPNGREINYEVFYKIDVNKMKIRLSSIFIDEGGHLNQSSLEKIFMLELKSAI
ncbi:S8 family serine peptidase [bacterium]|jgi:hypothetical protein|nr:S8 family serine peptidase [bacterium]MBT3795335.1 S8 family serine peptidase [bacterium]